MKKTGIKVWVLTGDKVETAINIGLSAGLLDNDTMEQYIITDTDINVLRKELTSVRTQIDENMDKERKQAIIVSGASLLIIDSNEDIRDLFLSASDKSDVLLACRVSPK